MSSASPVSVTCFRMKLRSLGWSLSSASEMSWSCSIIVQLPGFWFIYRCRRVTDINILGGGSVLFGARNGRSRANAISRKKFYLFACSRGGRISQSLHSEEFYHHAKGHRLFYIPCQHRLRRQ